MVHNSNWNDHLVNVRSLLQRLREHGRTAGPNKCFLAHYEIKYLGFDVGNDSLSPLSDRISDIMNMPLPQTKNQPRSFLRHFLSIGNPLLTSQT